MDNKNIQKILQSFGISPESLGPEKLQKLFEITDKLNINETMSDQNVSKIIDILDIKFNKKNKPKVSIKIGRNEKCICESGKKWKKCCGKIS